MRWAYERPGLLAERATSRFCSAGETAALGVRLFDHPFPRLASATFALAYSWVTSPLLGSTRDVCVWGEGGPGRTCVGWSRVASRPRRGRQPFVGAGRGGASAVALFSEAILPGRVEVLEGLEAATAPLFARSGRRDPFGTTPAMWPAARLVTVHAVQEVRALGTEGIPVSRRFLVGETMIGWSRYLTQRAQGMLSVTAALRCGSRRADTGCKAGRCCRRPGSSGTAGSGACGASAGSGPTYESSRRSGRDRLWSGN